jgi:hypothetical protein
MLLPLNTTDEELEVAFSMLEKAMRRVAEERAPGRHRRPHTCVFAPEDTLASRCVYTIR